MDVISKQEALARGLKFYFTGKACIHGHNSERTVADWKCCECNRLRQRNENMPAERIERRNANTRGRKRYLTHEQILRRRTWTNRNDHHRRALKLGSGGRLSPGIKETLFKKQRGKCVYCRVDLTTVVPHLDHRMPLTLGGSNTDDNIQLLCPFCNLSKKNTHPDLYEARIGYVRPGSARRRSAKGAPSRVRTVPATRARVRTKAA